jgi:nitrogen fixation protein FixH
MMANAYASAKPLTGRTVLATIIGFFVVVFTVNGVFLFLAVSTNTGIVAVEPYRKGLKYNERIAADERQLKLGWKSGISMDAGDGSLVAVLSDRDGNAVSGLVANAKISRAVTDREDVEAKLGETAPGRYEAKLLTMNSGSYIANLEVSDPNTADHVVVFRARRRLWLKP